MVRDHKCRQCGVVMGHSKSCRHYTPTADGCKCVTSDGLPKTAFWSQAKAVSQAMRLAKSTGYGRPYRCPTVKGVWHVTRKPRRGTNDGQMS